MHDGILDRANRRAQRRLRNLVVARTYSDMGSRESRLYTQAERLVDSLQVEADWERSKAALDALMTADHDYHVEFGLTVAECEDCSYVFATESELRFAHGDR